MLKNSGGEGLGVICKVADFGLAVKMDTCDQTHMSGMFQGTLTHMAPGERQQPSERGAGGWGGGGGGKQERRGRSAQGRVHGSGLTGRALWALHMVLVRCRTT